MIKPTTERKMKNGYTSCNCFTAFYFIISHLFQKVKLSQYNFLGTTNTNITNL